MRRWEWLAILAIIGMLLVMVGRPLWGLYEADRLVRDWRAKYERIQVGMSLAEVEELVGSAGKKAPLDEVPQCELPGAPPGWHHVVWGDEYYHWWRKMPLWIGLQDGRVVSKHLVIHWL
jgi:hypothetical protein